MRNYLKRACTLILLILFVSVTSASVSLNLTQPSGNLEVIKGQSFNVQANVSCELSDCINFSVGLKIPNLETLTYDFSITPENDCFSGTCLAKPDGNGPLYIASGQGIWGCGKCFSGPTWAGAEMRQLVDMGCIPGMKNIQGVSLCFATDNGERWDLVFNSWPVGGVGKFVYTRSIERGLLDVTQNSLPFFITSSGNPTMLTFNAGESQIINFTIKATGNIGTYSSLVLFAADQEVPIAINIKENTQIPENNTNSTVIDNSTNTNILPIPIANTNSQTSRHRHITNGPTTISANSRNISKEVTGSAMVNPITITGSAISTNETNYSHSLWVIFGVIFFILLLIVLFVIIRRRENAFRPYHIKV